MNGTTQAILLIVSIMCRATTAFPQQPVGVSFIQQQEEDDEVTVATVSPLNRLAHAQACAALASHGISGGSIGGGVIVPINVKKRFARQAQEIIKEDAKRQGYQAWLYPSSESIPGGDYVHYKTCHINKPVNGALSDKSIKGDRYLLAAVKEATADTHTKWFPLLDSVKFFKAKYLRISKVRRDGDGIACKISKYNAYYVEVTFAADAEGPTAGARVWLQVWDVGYGLKAIQIEKTHSQTVQVR